jgi:hypothetical protein
VECGVRPILHPLHIAVLERIDMYIIHMPLIIGIITDLMLPIVALPDATFASLYPYV